MHSPSECEPELIWVNWSIWFEQENINSQHTVVDSRKESIMGNCGDSWGNNMSICIKFHYKLRSNMHFNECGKYKALKICGRMHNMVRNLWWVLENWRSRKGLWIVFLWATNVADEGKGLSTFWLLNMRTYESGYCNWKRYDGISMNFLCSGARFAILCLGNKVPEKYYMKKIKGKPCYEVTVSGNENCD